MPTLLEGVGEEGLLKRRVHHQEFMARRMREKSAELGKPVTQQVWVIDARNISLSPSGRGPALFRATTKQDSTYYPERYYGWFPSQGFIANSCAAGWDTCLSSMLLLSFGRYGPWLNLGWMPIRQTKFRFWDIIIKMH